MGLFELFFLWLLSGCRRTGGASGNEYEPAFPDGSGPGWPGEPAGGGAAPPWPVATATGPRPFPGPDWEFDEPPPAAVKERARQLVNELWSRGTGAYRVEHTAGRYIAYQAQMVASGKKGVVAYRQRQRAPQAPPALASRATPPRARPVAIPQRSPARVQPKPPAPAPSSPRPAAPTSIALPTLRKGWGMPPAPPHADVRTLQLRLGIAADGRFGAGTDAAVRAFQRSKGLQVDGIVGEKTWAALFGTGKA